MKKNLFFKQLKEIFEIDSEINEKSPLHLTSLTTLAIIALVDEEFFKTLEDSELKTINSVDDLMNLIGKESFI
jgi:acyl carrier protein